MTDDLKLFRADEPLKRLGGVLAVVAIVMLTITAHTLAYQDEVIREQMRAESAEAKAAEHAELASHLNALVAACMDGHRWVYVDPHTKVDVAVICETVELGRIVQ